MSELYIPYHRVLTETVRTFVERDGGCLIVDMHSYPNRALPYEDASVPRPSVCIGFDEFHCDEQVLSHWTETIRGQGLDFGINVPFSGSIVPSDYYRRDRRVRSMMLELRRDIYMREANDLRHEQFGRTQQLVTLLLEAVDRR